MFRAIRIGILLFALLVVSVSSWLTQSRSTDWNNTLWAKVYPINADGSAESTSYIGNLKESDFSSVEKFLAREVRKYGHDLDRPLHVELGREIRAQPPAIGDHQSVPKIMLWSIKMRWWAHKVTADQDDPAPDVRIFVRYHSPRTSFDLENSVGLQKGMVGIVNAFADRRHSETNNVIIAHEFLHTLGATDKYDPASGIPEYPDGYAEPDREPLYPQRYAEIMGGRIAESELSANIPRGLKYVIVGTKTATEIRLLAD
jgi:hypothetical protein